MLRYAATLSLCTIALMSALPVHAQSATDRSAIMQNVVRLDRGFAKLAFDSSAQRAYDRYLSPDAILFRPRAMRASEARVKNPLPPNLMLTWEPEYGDISRAGDFAYTTGQWIGKSRRTERDPQFGQYVTIWRKQLNGSWLAVFTGVTPTPPAQQGPGRFRPARPAGYAGNPGPDFGRATLLKADHEFSTTARALGFAAALRPAADPMLRLMRVGDRPSVSADSALAMTIGVRVALWSPVEAVVARSGDIGYTRGTYSITVASYHEEGDYIRIWRRGTDGKWRVAVDLASPAA